MPTLHQHSPKYRRGLRRSCEPGSAGSGARVDEAQRVAANGKLGRVHGHECLLQCALVFLLVLLDHKLFQEIVVAAVVGVAATITTNTVPNRVHDGGDLLLLVLQELPVVQHIHHLFLQG